MANTIESTTDEELLRSIIDGSIEEFEEDALTGKIAQYKFRSCQNLKKVILPNANSIGQYAFSDDTAIERIEIPKVIAVGDYAFSGCSSLTMIDLSGLTSTTDRGKQSLIDSDYSRYFFNGCSSLRTVRFDSLTEVQAGNRPFGNSSTGIETIIYPVMTRFANGNWHGIHLKIIDNGPNVTLFTDSGYYVGINKLEALIIRSNTVATLNHANLLGNSNFAKDSTKGQSGKNSTYKIYVPENLISSYQSATNWSAYSTFFTSIEGSPYENYWADGMPIGLSGTGLIAYYDIANVNDWDSETKAAISHVDNDFTAFSASKIYGEETLASSTIPTTFYDGKYALGGLNIEFNTNILNVSDTITIEFIFASTSTNGIDVRVVGSGTPNAGSQFIGAVGTNFNTRTFCHVSIEITSDNNIKLYKNNVLIRNWTSSVINNFNRHKIRISPTSNCYMGHVSIWNKALTDEERTQHYTYYSTGFHIGETAYDSNGNFIAGQS